MWEVSVNAVGSECEKHNCLGVCEMHIHMPPVWEVPYLSGDPLGTLAYSLYIYIYIYKERERERDYVCVYIYIYYRERERTILETVPKLSCLSQCPRFRQNPTSPQTKMRAPTTMLYPPSKAWFGLDPTGRYYDRLRGSLLLARLGGTTCLTLLV